MSQDQDKLLALALQKLALLERQECFDPNDLTSRPTESQQRVISDFGIVPQQFIRAGNQCLAKGTLVATPTGPVAIEHIKVGDLVYSEHGLPIRVLKTFNNGIRKVSDLTNRGVRWVSATDNHVFQVITPHGNLEEKKVENFGRDDKVTRVEIKAPLGTVNNPTAYALGALLGDGCSRQPGKRIQLSSANSCVPNKVAAVCGTSALKLHKSNYNWSVGHAQIEHYNEWVKNRYAHEKIVDLSILKTWNRNSLLKFVAGLMDTDGSVYAAKDHVSFTLGMQAKSVVDAFEYAVLALWQVPLNRTLDSRIKYKNGPVHIAYTRNTTYVKKILEELEQYLVSPQKKWKEEYNSIGIGKTNLGGIGLRSGFNTRQEETYDIHVDSPTNLYLLANGLVTHNSGKSQTCARILTWVITDTHPNWKRPQEWGKEPVLAIVAGRTGKQLEDSLLPKIKSYLEPGTYKEVRVGNMIQRLELENGSRVIFQSLENPQQATERLQSYVAHITWCDELPPTLALIRELLVRTQARRGYNLFSFTPTSVNTEVQKYVDSLKEPAARVYRFSMLDNPLYKDPVRRKELIDRYSYLSPEQQKMVFEGEWLSADGQVYHFDYTTMVEFPAGYSPMWRHVESVDPAISSALGLTIWAENPLNNKWYCIKDIYIKGVLIPTEIVKAVQQETRGLNIVRRISDYAPWYTTTASSMGIQYLTVQNKNHGRKEELTKALQQALLDSIRIAPHCTRLIDELQDCRWSDKGEGRIVNHSSFHLIDSAQYFVDIKPRPEKTISFVSQQDYLYQANEKRKLEKFKAEQKVQRMLVSRNRRWK